MNIFPSAGFVWFFYKYLCNRNPFLLQTEAPQGAAMLIYKGRAEKVWLLVYCIHLPHLPVSPTDSDVMAGTARHNMVVFTAVVSHLSSVDFQQTKPETK